METVGAMLPEVGRVAEISLGLVKMSLVLNSVPQKKLKKKKEGEVGGEGAEAVDLEVLCFQEAICAQPCVEVSAILDH